MLLILVFHEFVNLLAYTVLLNKAQKPAFVQIFKNKFQILGNAEINVSCKLWSRRHRGLTRK